MCWYFAAALLSRPFYEIALLTSIDALQSAGRCNAKAPLLIVCCNANPKVTERSPFPVSPLTDNRKSPFHFSCHTFLRSPSAAEVEVAHTVGLYIHRKLLPSPTTLCQDPRNRAA